MGEEIKFNFRSGRAAGALIGFAIGILVLIWVFLWKIILLIIIVLAGYCIGRIVDNKRNGTVIDVGPGRKE